MTKLLGLLNGKKSYLVAVLFVVLAGLKTEGYLTDDLYQVVVTLLGALGVYSLRDAISKVGKKK